MCTEFKSATGRHWRPNTWKCKNKDSDLLVSELGKLDINEDSDPHAPQTGIRLKPKTFTGKQRKSNVEVNNRIIQSTTN
jgi:hypothetical protein